MFYGNGSVNTGFNNGTTAARSGWTVLHARPPDSVETVYGWQNAMHRWRARTVGFTRHWDNAVAPHHIPWPVKAAVVPPTGAPPRRLLLGVGA